MVTQIQMTQIGVQKDETDESEFGTLPLNTTEEISQLNDKLINDESFKIRFVCDFLFYFLKPSPIHKKSLLT